jgi:hypothetical protein
VHKKSKPVELPTLRTVLRRQKIPWGTVCWKFSGPVSVPSPLVNLVWLTICGLCEPGAVLPLYTLSQLDPEGWGGSELGEYPAFIFPAGAVCPVCNACSGLNPGVDAQLFRPAFRRFGAGSNRGYSS